MKLIRNIALALCLGLTGAAIGGTALASRADDPWYWPGYVYVRDDDGRWLLVDDDDVRATDMVPMRFVNNRAQLVTLYIDGRYLGSVDPFGRERLWVPAGYHMVTYRVGNRAPLHQVSVTASRYGSNRVVIEGYGFTSFYP